MMTTMTTAATSTDRAALARRVQGVYLLTPDVAVADFDAMLVRLRAALTAGVALVQYRSKVAPPQERSRQARAVQSLAAQHGALFIVNDDVRLAQELDADGVHLGRDDGDIAEARAGLPHALIGVSCYDNLLRARRAVEAGADIVAFGSVFASTTKPAAVRAPLALLQQARQEFPAQRIVAIGGIGETNIRAVSAAGAHAAALIGAVFDAPDPAAAVKRLQYEFNLGTAQHEPQRTTV
jgi:thiamine-phosphate pyrophosphorylase